MLVAAGDWFCSSEPGLTLALWCAWMRVESAGFELFPHWQPSHTAKSQALTPFGARAWSNNRWVDRAVSAVMNSGRVTPLGAWRGFKLDYRAGSTGEQGRYFLPREMGEEEVVLE